MNDEQLQTLVESISLKKFKKPFRHQALFNNRLRTTGGRYLLQSHNIEINPKYLVEHGEREIIGIVKHELCHYHLHLEGKGHMHRDHDFRELLKQVNAPRYCTPLITDKKNSQRHIYRCRDCMQQYVRKRQVNTQRFVCGRCNGKLMKL